MKKCYCGPQTYPEWIRCLITKFVGYNEFCKIHDHEYEILNKEDADRNFLRFLASKGFGSFKLKIIKLCLSRGAKYAKELRMDKQVKQSVFLADLIFTKKDQKIHMIGGKVNEDEATLDGFKREILEETSINIKDNQISFLFYNVLDVSDLPDVWNQNFFTVKDIKFEDFKPSNEVAEIFQLDKNEFLNMDDESLSHAARSYKHYLLQPAVDSVKSR